MSVKETRCEDVDSIQLAQNRVLQGEGGGALVNTVMNLWVPHMEGEFLNQLSDHQLLKKDSASLTCLLELTV
jgi:hypothetical protein